MVGSDDVVLAGKLLSACRAFIREHEIDCADSIGQVDSIILAAPELVEQVCEIVGYYDRDSEEIRRE